ncbi:phosphatase [Shewanella sp. OPT22]|nr:phosphatase [Shewanella sp. OPT22]
MITRRKFIVGSSALAFAGLASSVLGKTNNLPILNTSKGYGRLIPDPDGLLDLPEGFSYRVISEFGRLMSDGFHVADKADGMGCIPLKENKVALVRNHELKPKDLKNQPASLHKIKTPLSYDTYTDGVALPGGTSTLIYDLSTKQVEKEFISLLGTIRNCSGGLTPWGSWLTCEESVALPDGSISKGHGYIFEVPADSTSLVKAKPLKAMGRFNHEAACVDPNTGIVYLTEDTGDSLFYRFVPKVYGQLEKGGQLQAIVIKGIPKFDTRNWSEMTMKLGKWLEVDWIDLDDPESPNDDLRIRGHKAGATLFARGEGIHWADDELYFCCTNGGKKQLGQVMRYQPKKASEAARIQLFLESDDESLYNFGDNLTVTPQGHLIVCEDQYVDPVDNHLRGVTPEGGVYSFARLRTQTEMAGACFSPDGKVMFVNVYSPTKTLAIEGPWNKVLA